MEKYSIFKYLLCAMITLCMVGILDTSVYATTISKENIPTSAYIIGDYMFTRNTNEAKNYDGKLTTNIIMLASKTIESNNLDDMIIYYKTASGKWINGLKGSEVSVPDSFNINYINLSLEDINDTVKAPKKPIIFWDTAQTYNKSTNRFSAWLTILIDDISDTNNDVDGIELEVFQNGGIHKSYDLTYNNYFKGSTVTFNENFKKDVAGIIVGNTYHTYRLNIDGIARYQGYGYLTINARAYALDENGKKVYSDMLVASIPDTDFLPVVNIKSTFIKIDEVTGNYVYQFEIEKPDGWSANNDYAYMLCKDWGIIGRFGLNEKVIVNVPKNEISYYSANIGYYNKQNKFIYQDIEKEITIDTRTLTTPILSIYNWSWQNRMNIGERICINNDFYLQQAENTLDNSKEGVEFYEVENGNYKLLSAGELYFEDFLPTNGYAEYLARVYTTNAAGEKVYSNFSNMVEIVRTPSIDVSEVSGGKIKVSINNIEQYSKNNGISFTVYNSNDQELGSIYYNTDNPTIEINAQNMDIYVKASVYNRNDIKIYSAKSNVVNIVVN